MHKQDLGWTQRQHCGAAQTGSSRTGSSAPAAPRAARDWTAHCRAPQHMQKHGRLGHNKGGAAARRSIMQQTSHDAPTMPAHRPKTDPDAALLGLGRLLHGRHGQLAGGQPKQEALEAMHAPQQQGRGARREYAAAPAAATRQAEAYCGIRQAHNTQRSWPAASRRAASHPSHTCMPVLPIQQHATHACPSWAIQQRARICPSHKPADANSPHHLGGRFHDSSSDARRTLARVWRAARQGTLVQPQEVQQEDGQQDPALKHRPAGHKKEGQQMFSKQAATHHSRPQPTAGTPASRHARSTPLHETGHAVSSAATPLPIRQQPSTQSAGGGSSRTTDGACMTHRAGEASGRPACASDALAGTAQGGETWMPIPTASTWW